MSGEAIVGSTMKRASFARQSFLSLTGRRPKSTSEVNVYADLYKAAAKHATKPVKVSVGAGPANQTLKGWRAARRITQGAGRMPAATAVRRKRGRRAAVAAPARGAIKERAAG